MPTRWARLPVMVVAVVVLLAGCDATDTELPGTPARYCTLATLLRADLQRRLAEESERDVPGEDPAARNRRDAAVIVVFHRDNEDVIHEMNAAAPGEISDDVVFYWDTHERAGETGDLGLLTGNRRLDAADRRLRRWEAEHCPRGSVPGSTTSRSVPGT